MAVHTVPQDVETDDKILGPFNLRQFLYLIAVVALGGFAYLLGRIFIALAIIPVPFMMFFLILALPLKKDQPMETYLAAKISFLTKNNKRIWTPGQSETTILITTPKKVEESRAKGLSRQEVSRRLSFLADIVDTEGYAIKGTNPNLPFNQEVYAEAENITDMYDSATNYSNIDENLQESSYNNRQNVIEEMRQASSDRSSFTQQAPNAFTRDAESPIMPAPSYQPPALPSAPDYYDAPQTYNEPSTTPEPTSNPADFSVEEAPKASNGIEDFASVNGTQVETPVSNDTSNTIQPSQDMVDLANNTDYTVETIAKEANRISEKQNPDGEVYISLH